MAMHTLLRAAIDVISDDHDYIQGIIYTSHRGGGFPPPKTFLTPPQHRSPNGGVNSSYTYPDRV